MCDTYWEPLAEICIWDKKLADPDACVYCLCSRFYVRYPEIYTVLPSEDEDKDVNDDHMGEIQDLHKGSGVEKHDEEPVSCYCSASHTDNNYSTDEHDSVRDSSHWPTVHSVTQKLGLHQSDSGADLSEYYDQHETKSIQNLVASCGKTIEAAEIENDYENVDALTEYNQASGDKESVAQTLSRNISLPNGEGHNEDLISQYDCDPYNYLHSVHYESNKNAIDIAWEAFWAKNGERLIWAAWIEKYADYINPDYFQNSVRAARDEKSQEAEITEVATEKYFEQNTRFPRETYENYELHSTFAGFLSHSSDDALKPATSLNSGNFSFDDTSRQEIDDREANENRSKIINLEISPDLPEDDNGWNPLSPFSTEENYEQHSNAEDERLLTKCDSINGSITKTNATSDSMTNVTKMTLTSSSCDSNSVHSSNLITSVTSSIESSITSSSSDQENELLMEDNDKYWQYLWRENFEIQYQKQYELFVANYKKHNMDYDQSYLNLIESEENPDNRTKQDKTAVCSLHDDVNSSEELSRSDFSEESDNIGTAIRQNAESAQSGNKIAKKNNNTYSKANKSRTQRLIIDSVGMLIKNLQISTDDNDEMEPCPELSIPTQDSVDCTDYKKYDIKNSIDESISSGDSLESVKDGLSIMGYSYEEDDKNDLEGKIVYRKRNLKRQAAKLRRYRRSKSARTFNSYARDEQKVEDINYFERSRCMRKNYLHSADGMSLEELTENCPQEIKEDPSLRKYYNKRYFLFEKYDEGIQLDAESWYSVTPEETAKHIANVCACDVIIDAFCGAGGNSIQFARTCKRVIAIDIDPVKIQLARNNARIYGVEKNIEFIVGDFMKLASSLKANVVFLSPPWGGPKYTGVWAYDLESILPPHGGQKVFSIARRITKNVVYYLPRNINATQLINMLHKHESMEIMQYMINGCTISCTVYFGDLVLDLQSWRSKNNKNYDKGVEEGSRGRE